MKLIEVNSKELEREFLDIHIRMHKGDPVWIRPLDDDIYKVFDKNRNRFFKHGELTRWILKDDQNTSIGRVSAFINNQTAGTFEQKTGNMGFFECVNDQTAANMLFDKCKEWLKERGMEAMNGPINFGERNSWWGLLVDGFTEPTYLMNYNKPYYQQLFENYGFQIYYKQFSYGMKVNDPRPQKYYERSAEIAKDPNYSFRFPDLKKIDNHIEEFRTVYNKSWGRHKGFREMTTAQAKKVIYALKPIMVDYLLWFGYYKDEPIAIYFNIPELNQYFKYVKGKMNWLGKIIYMYHKVMKTCSKFQGIIFGVVPEHQKKGVEGAIIMAASNVITKHKQWKEAELTWIGDFNPKMMNIAESLGATVVKTHHTYRILFDPLKPFKRAPILG